MYTTCQATRQDGQACLVRALPSGYCFSHDPARAEQRKAASARGGRNKSKDARIVRLTPASLKPVLDRLYAALDGLADGTTEARTATAMASVAGAIVRVYEVGQLEERLQALEAGHEQRAG